MPSRPLPRKRSRRPHGMMSLTAWRGLARNRTVYWALTIVFGVGIVAMFAGSPSMRSSNTSQDDRAGDVILTVNGDPVSRKEFEDLWQAQRRMQSVTEQESAKPQGQILQTVISLALLRSEAKTRGITVTDADIDRALTEYREQQGSKTHPVTDEDLMRMTGKQSMDELREQFRTSLLPPLPPLLPRLVGAAMSGSARLTEADLSASYDEIKVSHILIGVTGTPNPLKGALPDAQAKRRADEIAAKAKAGADFAALANEYTSDPSNAMPSFTGGKAQTKPKGGDLGWYKRGSGFAPAFEAAAFALAPGQIGGPVKTQFGYHIIKVEQKRHTLPADYEKTKAKLLSDLRDRKAGEALQEFLAKNGPTAKLVWKDPDFEWKYVYAKIADAIMYSMPGTPVSAEQGHLIDLLRAAVKRNSSDSTAAFVLGGLLHQQYMSAGVTLAINKRSSASAIKAPDRNALRSETIAAYETALARGEDREVRFALAQLYQDAKQDDKALQHYERILTLLKLGDDTSADKSAYERLQKAFGQLHKPDLVAEATARIDTIVVKEEKEALDKAAQAVKDKAEKEARDREAKIWMEKHRKEKAAQDAGKAGSPGTTPSGLLAPNASTPAPAGH
jgi:parvulin-like peptidyl-prolyl isomerase